MKLQIKDWPLHFENNKSRERDRCSFVCVPNKQDGGGLTFILSLEDGANIYGIWNLLLGLCSRQKRPRDGHLTDTGRADGRHLTGTDLALRWRRTEKEIMRAVSVLCCDNVGWIIDLEKVPAECPPSAHAVPARCPGREGKGREGKGTEPPPAVAPSTTDDIVSQTGFERFWQAWPRHHRKASRTKCAQVWKRSKCESIADHIVAMVEASKKTADWKKDGGAFIPAPLVWLNQGRWETELEDLEKMTVADDPWGRNEPEIQLSEEVIREIMTPRPGDSDYDPA